jgi:aryl-alcohol dehydrogenase-like predicted oxidoreductase
VDALRALANEAGLSMASTAVGWVLTNSSITSPIIGASRPEQLADSLTAEERGSLAADLMAKLDEVTHSWRTVEAER